MTFVGDKHVLSERRAQPRRGAEGCVEIVAEGTPEQVATEKSSYTVSYLKPLFKGERAVPKELALDEAAPE